MMIHDTVSIVKIIITLLLALLAVLVVQKRSQLQPLINRNEVLSFWLIIFVFRLLPFIVVFFIMGYAPRSDTDFFYVKALHAYKGEMVYRDFLSYHAPLFAYIISLPLFIWNNAKVLILFMTVVEALIAWTTFRAYADKTASAMWGVLLYYIAPVSFIAMILSSEEDIWIWGVGLASIAVTGYKLGQDPTGRPTARDSFWIGITWGIAMITIKSMVVVMLLPVFFLVSDKLRYVLGLAVIGIPSLVILYWLMGDAFLMPIQHSGYHMAPNFVSVTQPLLSGLYNSMSLTLVNTIGLVLTMLSASYVAIRAKGLGYQKAFPLVFVYTFSFFSFIEPSAPGFYLYTHMLPMIYVLNAIEDKKFAYQFILLNVLLSIQPVNWVLYAGQKDYPTFSAIFESPNTIADYIIQLVSVIILFNIVRRCFHYLNLATSAEPAPVYQPSSFK